MNKVKVMLGVMLLTFCLMADEIGVVNMQKAISNHPNAKTSFQEINDKRVELENEIKEKGNAFVKLKNELTAKEEVTDEERKELFQKDQELQQFMQIKQQELSDFEKTKIRILQSEIITAADEIKTAEGVDVILDSSVVISGGKDITDAVVEFLSGVEKINVE